MPQKGAVAVLIAARWLPGTEGFAVVGAIVGHCFPVWIGFRGGKGVATAAGAAMALAWQVAAVCALVWAATLAVSRISSLASLVAIVAAPVVAWLFRFADLVPYLTAVAVIVLIQHRGNIVRLRAGTEPRVGQKAA